MLRFFILGKLVSAIRANALKVVKRKGKQFVWLAKSQEIIVGIVDSRDAKHWQECQSNGLLVHIYLRLNAVPLRKLILNQRIQRRAQKMREMPT